MRLLAAVLGLGTLGAGLGLAGCSAQSQAPAPASSASAASPAVRAEAHSAAPAASVAPVVTKTVTKVATVSAPPATTAQASTAQASTVPAAPAGPAAPVAPAAGPNVTDPWAVVSAYYGDIESGNYAQAYALIGNGATTGQSYQQFAAGFACTGGQTVSENWDSGDQVNFDLTATDSCNGSTQYYTGTDTVENGTIVAADIVAA